MHEKPLIVMVEKVALILREAMALAVVAAMVRVLDKMQKAVVLPTLEAEES